MERARDGVSGALDAGEAGIRRSPRGGEERSENGIQAFTDGTFAFLNCTPTRRTLQDLDLSCGIFGQSLGATAPTAQSFMIRTVDASGGTTKTTNVAVGLQYADICADFDLNPVSPRGILAGTVTGRVRNGDGSCGSAIGATSAALVPSGSGAGATCPYRVVEAGACSPLTPFSTGSTICLPRGGTCRTFDDDIDIVLANTFSDASAYIDCLDVVVEPDEDDGGFECSSTCTDGLPAIAFSPGSPAASRVMLRPPDVPSRHEGG